MALLLMNRFYRRQSHFVRVTTAGMRAAGTLRAALLSYGRESDLAYLTHTDAAESARRRAKAELLDALTSTGRDSDTARQDQLRAQAARQVREYLEVRERSEQHGGPVQLILVTATPPLQRALDTLQALERLDFQAVLDAEAAASRWQRAADLTGGLAAGLLLAGFSVVLIGVRRMVFTPLLSLSDGIQRFTAGGRDARVELRGPAEFRQTAATFNGMLDQLAQQEERQRTFLAGVAHDLRNPLAALRIRVQQLQLTRELPPREKLDRAFATIARQVDRLEHMIGDFLDASQIERGSLALRLQSYDLRQVARDVVELFQAASSGHILTLTVPEQPLVVRCDPARIDQVLDNLVSNAIKYSPRGGEVTVTVSTQDGMAVIAVSDRGIGIPAGELLKVFEPYRRTAASQQLASGLGLGLFGARKIVQQHGGDIELQSVLGVGSTFRVRLPLATTAQAGDDANELALTQTDPR